MSLEEVSEMSVEEVYIWLAYFQIEAEETRKRMKK
tara:strand:+ start:250 stop:354 length:105 start_codon:yes stop_codon:yes gene_type:complete